MLAPIITKDMKLFPSRPLSNIKNVRSRAQSLEQVSALQSAGNIHGRVVPVRPRNSQSTGNLPAIARSPPSSGGTRKTILTAIQEGVEMSVKLEEATTSTPTLDIPVMNGLSVPVKKMTPSQAAKIDAAKKGKISTGSSSDSASDDGGERKENKKQKRKSVVKWITSAFRKNVSPEDKIAPENISTVSS